MLEMWISIRTDGLPGSGTVSDPFDGSAPRLFDRLMDTTPAGNTIIHLGPGVFQTRGYHPNTYINPPPPDPNQQVGWLPKAGQKIFGAGIDATILKLVDVSDTAATTVAIGGLYTNFLPNFEASDFTIDCNLAGQPIPPGQSYAPVSCAAVQVGGQHVRLRRLRAINFGSQIKGLECFVLSPTFAYPTYPETFDCVMENCIVEKPSRSNLYITTCLPLAGGETPNDGVMAYHRACGIRNCLLNFEYLDNPVGISGITYSGTTATVTTKFPHNRFPGQWVVVSGALENGVPSTNYNGAFQITAVLSSTQFQYSTSPGAPAADPTGEMYIGKYPSHGNPITAIPPLTGGPPYTVTVTTYKPHNRRMGDNVVITNVRVGGSFVNDFNGLFGITQILSPTMLTYQIQTNPGTPDLSQAQVGGFSFGLGGDAGIGAFAEGNRIYNCTVGGPYHDTFSTKDLVVRNNYYYNVIVGPRQAMGFLSLPKIGASLTKNGALAIFTTAQPHAFSAGAVVTVSGALVGGSSANPYNGTFQIASVPTPASFTYAMNSDPGADASGSPVCNGQAAVSLVRSKTLATFITSLAHGLSFGQAVLIAGATPSEYNGTFSIASVPSPTSFTYVMLSPPASDASGTFTFGALWQEGRLVIENNIIELVVNPAPYGQGYASGILVDSSIVAPYVFVQALIRGNLIRNVDNAFDASGTALGIRLISCQGAIIEDNIINLNSSLQSPPYNISHLACGSVKYFNNQTPAGLLIQGYDATNGNSVNELATDVDVCLVRKA